MVSVSLDILLAPAPGGRPHTLRRPTFFTRSQCNKAFQQAHCNHCRASNVWRACDYVPLTQVACANVGCPNVFAIDFEGRYVKGRAPETQAERSVPSLAYVAASATLKPFRLSDLSMGFSKSRLGHCRPLAQAWL